MSTARPEAEIRDELRVVEEDLTELRKTAASLREEVGDATDGSTDPEEHASLIENAEEQESLADQLEERRERLLAELGEGSAAPGGAGG
jgi:hypothetical protein